MARTLYMLVLCEVLVMYQIDFTSPFLWGRGNNSNVVPRNPCPNIFSYEFNKTRHSYVGHLKIPIAVLADTYLLEVKMSINARVPEGEGIRIATLTDDNTIYVGRRIEYEIIFPMIKPLPTLIRVTFNKQILCNGPPPRGRFGVPQISMWAALTLRALPSGITTRLEYSTYDPVTHRRIIYPAIYTDSTSTFPTYAARHNTPSRAFSKYLSISKQPVIIRITGFSSTTVHLSMLTVNFNIPYRNFSNINDVNFKSVDLHPSRDADFDNPERSSYNISDVNFGSADLQLDYE